MTARKKLTVAGINNVRAPKTGRKEYLDAVVPQLALRITANGTKSFVLRTRVRGSGKQIRVTLGEYPAVGLSEARDTAREALNMAQRGVDSNEEKRRQAQSLKERRANSVSEVSGLFIERYAKKRGNRTWPESKRILDRYVLPRWGSRPIAEIRKTDVVRLLDEVEDAHGIYMVNRTLAAIRKLFNWAMDERGLLEATPIGRSMARGKEIARDRVLGDEEIRALWIGCDALGYPFGGMIRLLLLTGQRRSEIAEMEWDELDLDQGLWTIPAARAKNELEHIVPLSPAAVDVIVSLPRWAGPYLFSTTDGQRPVSGFSTFKRRADSVTGVADWRLHDLRRTARTGLAALGVPEIVSEKVLNHQKKSLVSVYNRHDYLVEKRDALDRWARRVTEIVGPPPENVVPMRSAI
jgi:integrase